MSNLTEPVEELEREAIAALEGEGFAYNPLTTYFAEYLAVCLGTPNAYKTKSVTRMLAELNTQFGGGSVSYLTSNYADLLDTIEATIVSGGGAAVQEFAYQSETDAVATAFSVAPTAARKRTMDRLLRRLKTDDLWNDAVVFAPHGLNEDASLTCWKRLIKMTKVGSPTFVANVGWTGVSTTGYINTLYNISALNQNNLGVYVWSQTTTAGTNFDCGATDASSNGISVYCRQTTTNAIAVRLAGASTTVATGTSDGYGLNGASRIDANNVIGMRNGVQQLTVASASVALPSKNLYYLTNNGNAGPGTASPRQLAGVFVFNRGLTETEHRKLTGALGEYYDTIAHGEPIIEEVGIGTATINVSVAAIGFTVKSLMFVLGAMRGGAATGAIIGDGRDRWTLGGVCGGGLGFTDYDDKTALGGLPRYLIKEMNALEGVADTSFVFQPKRMQSKMRELLNPALNGGFTINLYQSNGPSAVTKVGTRITQVTTTDGRTVIASQWHEGSDGCDLIRIPAAGISYIVGREAAGSGTEALNGVDATILSFTGVDPFLTPGVPASGLLPWMSGIRSTFTPALDNLPATGAADGTTQAYNFRLTMTNNALRRVPLPTTPPPGYDVANYEMLLRFLAANSSIDTFVELVKADLLYDNTYDINNDGQSISTDFIGQNHSYPLATRSARETIHKQHWYYILGFLYTCQYGVDARIPAALKTDMATWGFRQDHYYAPHENDSIFEMPTMYVRECMRMVGDAILNGNDETATDGTTPRISDHTGAIISYQTDSHANRRIAWEQGSGIWKVAHEGGLGVATGGVNQRTPVPIEIAVPKATECTNLSTSTGVSATHVAFGAYRMEPTMWMLAYTMGHAAALAIAGDGIIQNVDYATLRTAVLASPALTGEIAPVLPQVN